MKEITASMAGTVLNVLVAKAEMYQLEINPYA